MDYWLKQLADTPLFPDILWSRPENKLGAGKLLIIGGNAHAIAAPVNAFSTAIEAGAGSVRVLLPDHVRKSFGSLVAEAEFAPSNPSGGFGLKALDTWLQMSLWADAVLLAGDFGHNSESRIITEKFLDKTTLPITITHDAVEAIYSFADRIINKSNLLLVGSLDQIQKFAVHAKARTAIGLSSDLVRNISALHEITSAWGIHVLTRQAEHYITAGSGKVITSPASDQQVWRVQTASKASVWWMQNPQKALEAVTSSLLF